MYPPTQQGQNPQQDINSYLVWSILTTLFCCLPLGIYSINCSAKVPSLVAQGRIEEAQAKAKEAKKWNLIGLITSVVFYVVYFLLVCVCSVFAD